MTPNSDSEKIENPNDGLKIPDWINEELFYKVLEDDIPGYSKIKRYVPIAAIGPGENYTSRMIRVHIDVELSDGSTRAISYIVKTAAENEATREMVDAFFAFPKERELYEHILPRFEQLYAEAGKIVRFGPTCKYVQDTPEYMTIIMEDLRQRGFSNVDRFEGLDLMHLTCTLEKLAEYHAASAVYNERFGPYSDQLRKGIFREEGREDFRKFSAGSTSLCKSILRKWGCEKYIAMWPSPDDVFTWFLDSAKPDPSEFNVLNHGDCWSNNIMFQHNEQGEVTDTYFVDYQLLQWGTPAQDLTYLITASAHYNLRIQQFDLILRIYQRHLAAHLKLLKYPKPIPSLKDIHSYMIKYSLWGFYTATTVLSAILAEPSKNANTENLTGDSDESEKFRETILMNPRYEKAMKQLLPWWENRGVFELQTKNINILERTYSASIFEDV